MITPWVFDFHINLKIQVDWVTTVPLQFNRVRDLRNKFNKGHPAWSGRDGQDRDFRRKNYTILWVLSMRYKKSVVRYREMMSKRYRDGLSLKTQIGVFIRSNKCGSISSPFFRVREVVVYKVHLFFILTWSHIFWAAKVDLYKVSLIFLVWEMGGYNL